MSLRHYEKYEKDGLNGIFVDEEKGPIVNGNVHNGKYNNSAHCGSQTNIEINININVSENTSPKALADLDQILEKIRKIRNG